MSYETVRERLIAAIVHLQELSVSPSQAERVERIVQVEMLAALQTVQELLPQEIQQQVQTLLDLQRGLTSPHFDRAMQMHQKKSDVRPDLPSWIQPQQDQ